MTTLNNLSISKKVTHATRLAVTLPAIALLTACATSTAPTQNTQQTQHAPIAYDRMMPERYMCDDGSKIMAKQSINKQQVQMTATVPALQLNQQAITLAQASSTSNMRYVNNSNPNAMFTWDMSDMNGDETQLKVTWKNGQSYQTVCKKI